MAADLPSPVPEASSAQTVWSDDDGATLFVSIEGYEFPESDEAANPDSQWLNVSLRLNAPGLDVRFVDPALTLNEAASLGAWWLSLARTTAGELPTPPLTFMDFAEPLLAFGLRAVEGDVVRLAVVLPQSDEEARIPDAWPDVLEVAIDRADLAENASEWLAALDALPPRR